MGGCPASQRADKIWRYTGSVAIPNLGDCTPADPQKQKSLQYSLTQRSDLVITVPFLKKRFIPKSFTLSFWLQPKAALNPGELFNIMDLVVLKIDPANRSYGIPSILLESQPDKDFTDPMAGVDTARCEVDDWCFFGITLLYESTGFQIVTNE